MCGLSLRKSGKLIMCTEVSVNITDSSREMAFADITISPVYRAAIGLVSDEKGLSLRFPRFLKKREDKNVEEASTSEFLAELWKKQDDKAPRSIEKLGYEVEDEEENGLVNSA
jgi:DNA ligase-1